MAARESCGGPMIGYGTHYYGVKDELVEWVSRVLKQTVNVAGCRPDGIAASLSIKMLSHTNTNITKLPNGLATNTDEQAGVGGIDQLFQLHLLLAQMDH